MGMSLSYTVEYDEKRSNMVESLGNYYQVIRDWDDHLIGFIIEQPIIKSKDDPEVVGTLWLCENDLTEGPFDDHDDAIMALIRIHKRRGG